MDDTNQIMTTTDIEYGQYLWLDYKDRQEYAEKEQESKERHDTPHEPDVDYVDNYYNDDLEKKPNLQTERVAVITIYAVIGLMLLYSFINK